MSVSAIDLASMRDPHYHHDPLLVIYGVNDTIAALPQAIFFLVKQSLCSRRTRFKSQTLNLCYDAFANLAWKVSELLRGGRLDQDAIACHAA